MLYDNISEIYEELVGIFGPDIKAKIPYKRVKSNLFRLRAASKKNETKEQSTKDGAGSKQITCDICMDNITDAPVVNVPCGHGHKVQATDKKILEIFEVCTPPRDPTQKFNIF